MVNILTTIIAWEVFQALATILIFILLTKILNKWTKDDSEKKKQIKKGFTIFVILMMVFTIISGFYRVSSYENVVLTKLNGKKLIVQDIGIHYGFLSSTQKIDLRNQIMTFPSKDRFEDSDIILTKDKIPIRISGILTYKITNSEKWAIQTKESEEQLFYKLSSIITEVVKKKDYEEIINNRENIEKEVFNKIEQDSIEKISFKLLKTSYTLDVVNAKSLAEVNEIKSMSLISQAESEAQANKIIQDSLKDFTPSQIDYIKTKLLAENPNIKWVLPSGTSAIIGETND